MSIRGFGCCICRADFGHQAALTAGLEHAVGDVVGMLDGDLQDPPELLPQMLAPWRGGSDVVSAVRSDRAGDAARSTRCSRCASAIASYAG